MIEDIAGQILQLNPTSWTKTKKPISWDYAVKSDDDSKTEIHNPEEDQKSKIRVYAIKSDDDPMKPGVSNILPML